MAEEDGFDDAGDGALVGVVEVVDGFEVEFEVVCWSSFVGFEEERVGAGVEGECDVFEDVECGG